MPFAGYKDFDDCVSKNRDKGDPKAYCATIMRKAESMSIHQDFQPIRRNFMRTNCGSADRDCPTGVKAYDSWLGSKGLDDKRGLPQKGFGESFAFLGVLEPFLGASDKQSMVKVNAIHNVCTRNGNCYDWDEIAYGFASLTDRPVDYCEDCVDVHDEAKMRDITVGKVNFARANPRTKSGEALLSVTPEIRQKVKDKVIKYASIVATGLGDVRTDKGSHIRYPTFTRIALLGPSHVPGDPNATVELVEGLRPFWDNGHSVTSTRTVNSESFGLSGGGGATKKVNETSTSGGVGKPAEKAGSTTLQNIEELHFTASRVGAVSDAVLSYKARQNLPATAFADPGNRAYPHHHADGSIDMAHLRNGNARAAQQNAGGDIIAHLERHKKELKVGNHAEQNFGYPTDGKWVPEGFILSGERVRTSSKEVWDAFMARESLMEATGAAQEAFEEELARIGKESEEAISQMRHVAGIVTGGTFVTSDQLDKCKLAMSADIKEQLKNVVREDRLPVFMRESATASRLTAIETAARVFEALEELPKVAKVPYFAMAGGNSQIIGEAYRRGFRDAILRVKSLMFDPKKTN